jgi:glyoxylase-like metal-dependent hydrolase (beta-lactamase superfamily II)
VTTSADRLIARMRELGVTVQWIQETHVHSDHLWAAPYLKQRLGGVLAMGAKVTEAQKVFGKLFNVRGGRLPEPEAMGRRYLKIP